MRTLLLLPLCLLPAFGAECEGLRAAKLPHTTILTAEPITGGSFLPPGTKDPLTGLPPFCRVVADASPSPDSQIRIEVWLPLNHWNGKMLGTGNGGFAGKISYGSYPGGLRAGYVVANTDMGMAVDVGKDASVFIGRPERWKDWGWRATHEMTVLEKALIGLFYGRAVERSYFLGCSTGGEQALMEAERFPDDYDGISAGAPANNRTGVHLSILWNYMVTHRDVAAYLPAEKLELLHAAVVAKCGRSDGLVYEPFSCKFDPVVLQCKADETACLTAAQVTAARDAYRGPVDPKTGTQLYPGAPYGSELDWGGFGPDPARKSSPPYAPIFQWVFGAAWDWRTFKLSTGFPQMEKLLANELNATSGDLSRFQQRGGKLIAYHGLADWLVVPGEALRYREAVLAASKTDPDAYYRLYFIPGMGHCGGGTGPNSLDTLKPLVDWVEKGIAPGKLTAVRGGSTTKRPVCPYPQVAKHDGTGSLDEPANSTCVAQ